MTHLAQRALALGAALLFWAATAMAQDAVAQDAVAQDTSDEHLTIELNAVEQVENACRISFLLTNNLGSSIDKAVFEAVLFDAAGQVDRLTLFDFGALPTGRPRVRQFSVPGLACGDLGQILFNGTQTCDGTGLDAASCTEALRLNNRTNVEILG